ETLTQSVPDDLQRGITLERPLASLHLGSSGQPSSANCHTPDAVSTASCAYAGSSPIACQSASCASPADEIHSKAAQRPRAQRLRLAEHPNHQVLRPDLAVTVPVGHLLGFCEHMLCGLTETLERVHRFASCCRVGEGWPGTPKLQAGGCVGLTRPPHPRRNQPLELVIPGHGSRLRRPRSARTDHGRERSSLRAGRAGSDG